MTYNVVMKQVNTAEFKSHMSAYLREVRDGEKIVLCDHNVPIATLTPIFRVAPGSRPMGLAKGQIYALEGAFAPMSEDELKDWYGEEGQS